MNGVKGDKRLSRLGWNDYRAVILTARGSSFFINGMGQVMSGKLVLSRRNNQVVVISKDGVEIARIHAIGDCKLAFEADRNIQIDRLEVWASKQEEKRAA